MLTVGEVASAAEGLRAKQQVFLEAVMDTGSISAAAQAVGISRSAPYDWLDAEEQRGIDVEQPNRGTFAYALQQAKKLAGEAAAGRIHWHSNHSPGMPGVIASIAAAKRYDPLWNDRLEVRHSGAVLQARVDLNQLDASERAELLRLTQRRLELASASAEPEPDGIIDAEPADPPA